MTIQSFSLSNPQGAKVSFSNIGAGITSIIVPDAEGNMHDVVLGYKNLEDYIGDGPCMGKVPGRYANRIAKGKMTINGRDYTLPINNGDNHLHGGPEGFANKLWEGRQEENRVIFTYTSKAGEMGYPGNLTASVEYSWSEDNELTMVLKATTDETTVVNLTNHTYFNLKGEGNGNILDHELKLYAHHYLPTDSGLIPTGELAEVEDTPMDFTTSKLLGEDIKKDFPALNYGKGYDNCWVVDNYKQGEERVCAELICKEAKRRLTISTTQPGVQIYTGNWLSGSPMSKSGKSYNDYDGVAIECQAFPDSINKSNFPSVLLTPQQEYVQTIKFKFTTL
ncbi:MAG: galactose mutarotase [Bacteroidales bacterium]|nr:galactose mutarotase [Bacteroidales bacterium]